MEYLRHKRALFAWPLISVMLALTAPVGFARAALVSTDVVLEQETVAAQRDAVETFLSRGDVRRQMIEMGVDPAEAEARVGSLSDAEVARLAARIETAPAGQAVGSAVILLLVIVLIILLWPFN